MLTQKQIDDLLVVAKKLKSMERIDFPSTGSSIALDATDTDGREIFLIDVQRKGRIKLTKCTYQERYHSTEILLRLDIDGPIHDNPDGESIPCPHLHIYKEGFAAKWAYPLPVGKFGDTTDLVRTLIDFLKYCGVEQVPDIQRSAI